MLIGKTDFPIKAITAAFLAAVCLMAAGCRKEPSKAPPRTLYEQIGIDTLHYIKYSGISGVSSTDKSAFAAAISSLQGLMNRFDGGDAVFMKMSNEMDWTEGLAANSSAFKDWGKNFRGLIADILPKARASGYVLMKDFGSGDDELNLTIACSYASANGAFILTETLAEDPLFTGYDCVADTRDKTMQDVYEMLRAGKFARDGVVSVNRVPNHNVDLAIRHRWACIKSANEDFTDMFFSEINPCSVRISYNGPTTYEGLNVRCSSRRDLYVTAAGMCCNMSTHERIRPYQSDIITNRRSHPVDYSRKDVHYVSILISDGGNLEYFEGKFRKCYESRHYGEFPLSFMMSPMLKRFKPLVQDWYMTRVAQNCCVITSLSGAGDIFPSCMSSDAARERYGKLTWELMEKEGQVITAIMDRNDIIQYNMDTLVRYSAPVVRQLKGCKGVLFLGFAFMMDGAAAFIGDVPIVTRRFGCSARDGEIMDLDENPESQRNIAAKVKALPKDAESPDGYSVIMINANIPDNVEPKPDIMDDTALLVEYLRQDPGIEIVNLRQFFDLYSYHLKGKLKQF